jgi:hypothetical protein
MAVDVGGYRVTPGMGRGIPFKVGKCVGCFTLTFLSELKWFVLSGWILDCFFIIYIFILSPCGCYRQVAQHSVKSSLPNR